MVHAISVDGTIERIEGSAEFADAEIEKRRKAGHSSEYLFAAATLEDFERWTGGAGRSCLSGSLRTNQRHTS